MQREPNTPNLSWVPITLVLLLSLLLAACGGGGGGGAGSGSAGSPPPAQVALGSRAMPDGTVSVAVEGGIRAAASNTFLVSVPADYPAIAKVEAGWAVAGAPIVSLAAVTTARSPDCYAVSLDLPAAIPAGTRVFVRLTHVDGNVIESGIYDFLLP